MSITIGDTVVCVDGFNQRPLLTEGKDYTVIGVNELGEIQIVSDIAIEQWFYATRFEKVKNVSKKNKYRQGDVITLEAVVLEDRGYNLEIKLPNGIGNWFLDYDEVKSHTPKTVEVGDTVRSHLGTGTVKFIDGQNIWLTFIDVRDMLYRFDIDDIECLNP